MICDFDATQAPIKFLLSLAFCTSHIQSNVNHIVVTRHVGSPVDSELINHRRLTGPSVAENVKKNVSVSVIKIVAHESYTSTSTGKAASLSSSRQLGGKRICTAARVPCVSGISKERCVGRAIASSFLENCFRVSYNTLISR